MSKKFSWVWYGCRNWKRWYFRRIPLQSDMHYIYRWALGLGIVWMRRQGVTQVVLLNPHGKLTITFSSAYCL